MLNQFALRRGLAATAMGLVLFVSAAEASLAVMMVVKFSSDATADEKQVAHDKALKAAQAGITLQCRRGMIVRSKESWKYTQSTDPDQPGWKAHVDVSATCDDPGADP